jgi:hypothetical protein
MPATGSWIMRHSRMIDRQTLLRDAVAAELQTMKPDVRFRD